MADRGGGDVGSGTASGVGMLYADDTGVVPTSPRGLIRMRNVIVVACQELGLTVSEKNTEAIHLWPHPNTASNALQIEATGQWYKQTTEFVYLGGAISGSADLDTEIKRCIGAGWTSVRKYSLQSYDRRNARLSLKISLFKAEVMKAMLYGCVTWIMRSQDFSSLRTAHHMLLLRTAHHMRCTPHHVLPVLRFLQRMRLALEVVPDSKRTSVWKKGGACGVYDKSSSGDKYKEPTTTAPLPHFGPKVLSLA